MKYFIAIDGVDCDTNVTLESSDPKLILKFLEKYDHEGSSVLFRIEMNSEEAYEFLKVKVNL